MIYNCRLTLNREAVFPKVLRFATPPPPPPPLPPAKPYVAAPQASCGLKKSGICLCFLSRPHAPILTIMAVFTTPPRPLFLPFTTPPPYPPSPSFHLSQPPSLSSSTFRNHSPPSSTPYGVGTLRLERHVWSMFILTKAGRK